LLEKESEKSGWFSQKNPIMAIKKELAKKITLSLVMLV
jgi:hypothetical protein